MRILILISLALTASILNSQDYFSDRLFVKLKEEYKTTYVLEKDKSLRILLSPAELVSAKPVSAHPFLNSTYELIFDKNINLDSLILRLNRFPEIEFAEKVPLYKLFFTPNDPLYSTQWNLSKIQADLAWNLSQGCTQVKVAVTDDGFLMTHEDLVNQWHINTGEIAGNGIDDDGNGYIDDWRGWDAANNDNDPSATAPTNSFFTHGTHVAGIIAGQTHNSKGIAAIGYNCKMIPVKIGLSSNSWLTGALQGLDYAINASGCDVINMSWGGGGWSATYQTLFNIAKTKGIICVAAAGNSNTSTPMYPASYNHVISVAASASTDARASFSNYGSTIDVTAPGVGIPSCLAGATNSYGNLSGTSMASPLVAGLCALMKCYNPLPADSIEACLKRTCDNINAQNPSFVGQLGAGRINAFQALQCLTKKPKSYFIALDTFQCTGKSVRYAARSFGIPTLTYNWSFPGGSPTSSTAANPGVTYTSDGYKSATLITCNSLGCDTITKANVVNIDTPKASLIGRKYTSYNSNQVLITIKFTGNPPYSVTLTDGTNTWTQSNVKTNPYFLSIVPKKDTSLISISTFSDSLCVGNKYGVDTIHRTNLGKDTTICVVLKTSNTGAIDGFGFSPTTSTNITWTFTNNENVVANWTAGGVPHFWRNILKFNLASIPANAIINSASLSLYSKPNASHGWTGQPTAGTDNSSSISRITNAWTTSSISTSSWPSITTQNQVILTQSPTNSHSYLNIDIKNLVQDLITTNDFGLFLRHVNTPYYNSLIYYSAEETDTSKHPKLVLCYTIPGGGSSSGGPLCRDSTEINSAQTGWQALQTNGSWGSLTASNYCAGAFTPNASLFPSMTASDCIWGPFTETGNRTAYNSASWTTTSVYSCSFARLKKSFSLPSGSIIDSVRLWMVSDDFIDSVWVNNKLVFKAMNPIQYGQILMLGNEINIGNSISPLNEVIVKSGDAGGCYGTYFRMKVYYSKVCENSTSDCDTTNLNTGKVLHLDFNGNTQDKSGLGNHATNFGATAVAGKAGIANTAYRFDGVNDYMRVANSSSINNFSNNKITLCAILRPQGFYNGTCKGNSIIMKGNSDHVTGNYLLRYSPNNGCSSSADTNQNNFYGAFSAAGGCTLSQIFNPPYVKRDTWYCLVVVSTGDSIFTYINGIKRYSCSYNGGIGSHNLDLFIGKLDNSTYPYWLNADVDDIRIYNRSLAPSEVKGYCGTCNISVSSDCDTTNLNTGKVLHLDFNGNTQDKSGNGNHAANFGATPVAGKGGVVNTAYKFNGTSNYMRVSNNATINSMTQITMCAILKPKGFYNGPCMNNQIISKNNINNSGHYSLVYSPLNDNGACSALQDSNKCNFYSGISSGGCSVSTVYKAPFIKKDSWYCVVTTYDGDTAKNYVNGELRFTCKINLPLGSNSADLFIGKLDNITFPYWLNADVDDIRIYNRALAPSEVKGYCGTCNVTPPSDCDTADLLACYPFSGNVNDSIGNNHGTVNGANLVTDRYGNSNSAYNFDGVNDDIQINATLGNFNTSDYTISFWMKMNNNDNSIYRFIEKRNICNFHNFWGINITNGQLQLEIDQSNSSNYLTIISKTKINDGNWHQVSFVRKGNDLNVFIDGKFDTVKLGSMIINSDNSFVLKFGTGVCVGLDGTKFFLGQLDDIKIYKRALNTSEVSYLYAKPFTCSCNAVQPPPCDTSRRFTFTQCLNDSIQVIARAGSKYQWSPVSGLSNDTIRNPNVFVSNNQRYLVSYTSLKNCQLIDTIDVDVKAAAIYPKMEDQIICIGDSVQMTIPISATNIVWSPNAAISSTSSKNPYFFPTSPSTYYLEFRDTFGCLHRDTFVVNTKACCPARARFTIPKDLLCFGETLLVSNTSKGPITSYSWNFGSAIPNTFSSANPPILTFPSGGSYTLRLIVTNGSCQDTMEKTITVVQIMPNAGKDTFNCLGAFTVQLGESAISDWSYSWTPSKFLNDPNIANPICNIVNDSVNYILEITDRSSGCMAYDTVVVYTNRNIVSKTTKQRICSGDSVLFNNNYSKTTNLYYYTIKKTDGICDSFIDILDLNVLQKQVLTYTPKIHCEFYIDGKGKRHDTSYIEQDTIRSKSLLNCDSIINITPREIFKKTYTEKTVQGCSPFLYNGKTYITSKVKEDSIRIRGAYSGCDSIIEYINVIVYPKPKAEISPSIPNPVLYKQTVTLTASGGSGYLWLQMGSTNSEIDYKLNQIQPRLFTVRVTDDNNCWDTVSYIVNGELPDTCYYGFPNAFTPNQDGLNDEYIPNMDECTEIKVFAIYDRWGEKVFETNQQKGWNGFYKGKPAPLSVYLYYAELITPWGIKIHKGNFTLIR